MKIENQIIVTIMIFIVVGAIVFADLANLLPFKLP